MQKSNTSFIFASQNLGGEREVFPLHYTPAHPDYLAMSEQRYSYAQPNLFSENETFGAEPFSECDALWACRLAILLECSLPQNMDSEVQVDIKQAGSAGSRLHSVGGHRGEHHSDQAKRKALKTLSSRKQSTFSDWPHARCRWNTITIHHQNTQTLTWLEEGACDTLTSTVLLLPVLSYASCCPVGERVTASRVSR